MYDGKLINLIYVLVVFSTVGFLYRRYLDKHEYEEGLGSISKIRDFLSGNEKGIDKNKPPLWIYLPYETNSRVWESFSSRNSKKMNLPYVQANIRSIIKNCKGTFNICLINDDSFKSLLPEWKTELSQVANPLKEKIIYLGLMKLIYKYGGILVPKSFLCMSNLIETYVDIVKPFVFQKHQSMLITTNEYSQDCCKADPYFMGCEKNNDTILRFINYIEILISRDATSYSDYMSLLSRWCDQEMTVIDGRLVGIKDKNEKPIKLENLFENEYLKLDDDVLGINIPEEEIQCRSKYNWFVYLNDEQLAKCNNILCKHMVIHSREHSL